MLTCANCATQNEPNRKFCVECGHSLAAPCPVCGTENPASAKFCGECGTTLAAAAAGGSRSGRHPRGSAPVGLEPVAERRLVSVLFVDLVGFTSASEQRDAEDTRDLLTRYFDIARETVDRHGGVIEKFIGDAVMAVWGTPTAHEDDAERAVRAALELVSAVSVLDESLRARAGVLDRRGGRDHRRGIPGHGRRGHGQHRVSAPVRGRAGHRARRRVHAAGGRGRDRVRGDGGEGAQGEGRRQCACGAPSPSSPAAAVRGERPRSSLRSWAVTRSFGCSRNSSMPPHVRESRGWSRSSARPASGRAASRGSWRSTWTASSRRCCGTRAAPRRTAKGSATGRWRRSSAAEPASPSRRIPMRPAPRSRRCSPGWPWSRRSGTGSNRA